MTQTMTFRDYYLAEKAKPTPLSQWITKISAATGVGEAAIRQWAAGKQIPTDYKICKALTEVLGTDYDTLFPAQQQ